MKTHEGDGPAEIFLEEPENRRFRPLSKLPSEPENFRLNTHPEPANYKTNPIRARFPLNARRDRTYNRHMRRADLLALVSCLTLTAQTGTPLKRLMLDRIHPASNVILLTAFRGTPISDADWTNFRRSALDLADAAAELTKQGDPAPSEWNKAATLLSIAAADASRAAQARDAKLLPAITTRIDASCTNCHKRYRPNVFPPEGASGK